MEQTRSRVMKDNNNRRAMKQLRDSFEELTTTLRWMPDRPMKMAIRGIKEIKMQIEDYSDAKESSCSITEQEQANLNHSVFFSKALKTERRKFAKKIFVESQVK